MTIEVINGLFVLGAAAVGSTLTIIANRSQSKIDETKEQNNNLQKKIDKMNSSRKNILQQIEAYHLLEDAYASELASRDSIKPKKVKEMYRNKVVENHDCVRPIMTATEAKKRLDRI